MGGARFAYQLLIDITVASTSLGFETNSLRPASRVASSKRQTSLAVLPTRSHEIVLCWMEKLRP